jgi:serine/threonine protein phosphatase PrpC
VIPYEKPLLTSATATHPGKRRPNNEDRFHVGTYQLEQDNTVITLAIVADGIGGHQAGEVAAQLTIDTLVQRLLSYQGGDPLPEIQSAIIEAGRVVSAAAHAQQERSGMGSTVALAMVVGSRLYTAHVGDSRIYLLRNGRLQQISIDHTWVQEAVEYDIIGPDEARGHPHAHILRRHIGGEQLPEPDTRMRLKDGESDKQCLANQGTVMRKDDRLLLCSDGLTDLVEDIEIYRGLTAYDSQEGVEYLTQLALERGGDDNITLIILAAPSSRSIRSRKRRRRRLLNTLVAILVMLSLIVVGVFGTIWFGLWPWF